MLMTARFMVVAGTVALLASAAANAQAPGEATIYGRAHFDGPSLSFTGPVTRINPPFTAKSVQVAPGTAWELCSGNTFSGCRRIDRSIPSGVFSVRSARPIAPVITTTIEGAAGVNGASPPNQALRGVASEFFVAPNQGGQRVSVPNDSGEGMRRAADDFCRAAGWRQSVHARLQSVGGTYYLVDVLCSNDAG
jgi:hypothetical protein